MADFRRNGWPDCVGISGRLGSDYARSELRSLGMTNQLLVLNGVFHATDSSDPLAVAVERRGAVAIAHMPDELVHLQRTETPLLGWNIVGLDNLRLVFMGLDHAPATSRETVIPAPGVSGLADLIDELARVDHGLVMVMGKGGVGKTTVAAAVAVALAKRGLPIYLTTTDPAQHI